MLIGSWYLCSEFFNIISCVWPDLWEEVSTCIQFYKLERPQLETFPPAPHFWNFPEITLKLIMAVWILLYSFICKILSTLSLEICDPLTLDYGMIDCEYGDNAGDMCSFFTCDAGFKRSGSDSRTCYENGTWSGEPDTCTNSKYSVMKCISRLTVVSCATKESRACDYRESIYMND